MKTALCLLLCLFACANLRSQNKQETVYFDKDGRAIAEKQSFYFRQTTDTVNYYLYFYTRSQHLYFKGRMFSVNDTLDKGQVYEGPCTWYYDNGKVKKEAAFKNSLPDGHYSEFSAEGLPVKEAAYANGLLNGSCSEFYKNGKPSKVASYEAGQLEGMSDEFYESGKLSKHVMYHRNRIVNNRYTEYTANGDAVAVFSEDFSNNSNSWPLTETGGTVSKVKLGGMQIFNQSSKDYGTYIPLRIDSTSFSIETLVNSNYINKDNRTGLIYAFKDWNNYQYFFITRTKYYSGLVKEGKMTESVTGAYSKELNPYDWNKLKLAYSNDSMTLYINEKFKLRYRYDRVNDGDQLGYFVCRGGAALFDNLVVRQFAKSYVPEVEDTRETFAYMGKIFAVQSQSSGLVISRGGYIATSLSNLRQAYKIVVKAYINDTLRLFFADIDLKNELQDLAVLKINNLDSVRLHDISYSLLGTEHLLLDTRLKAFYTLRNPEGLCTFSQTEGSLKSYACYENMSGRFDASFKEKVLPPGAPVFTEQGELVGIIQEPDGRQVNMRATKSHFLPELLFNFRNKMEVGKMPKDNAVFNKAIYKNIVAIIVL